MCVAATLTVLMDSRSHTARIGSLREIVEADLDSMTVYRRGPKFVIDIWMNEWMTKTLKSRQNRLSLPMKKNKTKQLSLVNIGIRLIKMCLLFLPMRIYASTRPLPLPVTKCHTERTPSLKRNVINEWPQIRFWHAAYTSTAIYNQTVRIRNTLQIIVTMKLQYIVTCTKKSNVQASDWQMTKQCKYYENRWTFSKVMIANALPFFMVHSVLQMFSTAVCLI